MTESFETPPNESHPFNGYDEEGNLWVFGIKAKKGRKSRERKEGSMSRKHYRKVTGDLRMGGGVGSFQNADHQGSNKKRPVETRVENEN